MSLQVSLPFSKKGGIKDMVFTILAAEYPLRIVELYNYIRKRYGRSVTFQAVRKAVLELTGEGVLKRTDNKFSINEVWLRETKSVIDGLYESLTSKRSLPHKVASIDGELNIFAFSNLNDLMKFWENIVDDWQKNFKRGDYAYNCYQGRHLWGGLLHPDTERKVWRSMIRKKIKCYSLSTGTTQLDKYLVRFYRNIGLDSEMSPSSGSFDKSYYIATYGDLIIQTRYPESIVRSLEDFFCSNATFEDFDLSLLSDIVNKRIQIKLTVIKNLEMAKQVNNSIISKIE